MTLPGGSMRDGYLGGITSASFIPHNPRTAFAAPVARDPDTDDDRVAKSPSPSNNREPWFNQTDEYKMRLSSSDVLVDTKINSNINKTEEYNVGYAGLSILPWEEFAFNPRVLNELFYQERTKYVTYDPDDVNVFFHGKNVMPPSVGDISENGKSWNVVVDTVNDLRRIRQWLTEKCSVFGVTLQYQEKRFGKKKRAPCLVMLDPSKGTLGDKLYTTITRAMDSLHRDRRFCVEINLNGCVERWCRRVLLTECRAVGVTLIITNGEEYSSMGGAEDVVCCVINLNGCVERWCRRVLLTECRAVGAKLIITNGEEYSSLGGAEDVVCCVVCLPLWLLQAGIYKLHRKVVYDDYFVDFDADDLFLHGTFQDATCQRQQIFSASENGAVFRTRSAGQTNLSTLQELGSFKFVSVKKYKKHDNDPEAGEEPIDRMTEHKTMAFNELVQQRKEKIIKKEQKILKKTAKSEYPKALDNKDVASSVGNDETNVKTVHEAIKENTESEGVVNHCCEMSDEEDESKMLHIPEVASVFYNETEDGSDFTAVSDDENDQRLFSPKLKNETSMSLNNALFDSADFDTRDSDIQPFKAPGADDIIDDGSDSDEDDSNEQPRLKNDLLNEMSKIESSLPTVGAENKFAAKDLESLAKEEKLEKEKSKKKKKKRKHKNKPAVGKVLKDLMKTTEKTDAALSAEDTRYQNALTNLNKKHDPKKIDHKCTEKDNDTKVGIDSSKRSTVDKDMLTNVSVLSDSSDVEENKTLENHSRKYEIEAEVKPTDVCKLEQFTLDDSSTDGDDVEMLYQSDRTEKGHLKTTNIFAAKNPDKQLKMSTPKHIESKPLHDDVSLNIEKAFQPVTDETKLELFALNSNRNPKFNSAKLFDASASTPSFSTALPVKSVSQTMDLQDADLSDGGIDEVETVNIAASSVKSPSESRSSTSSLKAQFASGSAKTKQKRGTKQYNSNRKYLGASVPGFKKKTQKNS